jgi:polar amino acid transport system substrate-binding protein
MRRDLAPRELDKAVSSPLARPWVAALMIAAACPSTPAEPGGVLRLASDDWCPFACVSARQLSGGFLVDATALALAASGYRVKPLLMPMSRAMLDTLDGHIEGIYAPPIDPRLRLSAPLAYSRACFYTRSGSSWTYQGIASLAGVTVGVIDQYSYDDGAMEAYIAKHREQPSLLRFAPGADAGSLNLQRLLAGRYPVMLEHEAVVAHWVKGSEAAGKIRKAGCLEGAVPLSIGFSKGDARAEAWMRALDAGLKKLEAEGGLEPLRRRYGIAKAPP